MTKRNFMAVLTISALIAAPAALAGGGGPDGAAIYKSKCAMCHGPDGAGLTPMGKNMKLRDLRTADVQKRTDTDLAAVIANGKGRMPAYKAKMTPADIDALVTFIRSIKK
jgi:mono/diheme cytochrome c family protein